MRIKKVGLLVILSTLVCFNISSALASSRPVLFTGVLLEQGNNPLLERFTRWLSTKTSKTLSPAYKESYKESYQVVTDYVNKINNRLPGPVAHHLSRIMQNTGNNSSRSRFLMANPHTTR
ncbi:MAG: hypothetical protein ACE5EH_04840 [Gammaproteobacteria bacterium]